MAYNETIAGAGYKVIRTEGGRLRVDIPASVLEADDPESLLDQVEKRLEEMTVALGSLRVDLEETALRKLDQSSSRLDALEKYAASHSPPQEWFDEPEWWNESE